jgi:hypothetical protein
VGISEETVQTLPLVHLHRPDGIFFFIKKLKELNAINKLKELNALQQHVDNLIGELEKLCR